MTGPHGAPDPRRPTAGPPVTLVPIGRVVGGRSEAVDDDWDHEVSTIVLDPSEVDVSATDGLDEFSHLEVVFLFDRVDESAVCRGSRHPRGNVEWPSVGILAQRARDRPNRIGITVCRLVAVRPHAIEVRGLDAVDGTPVLDVKPYLTEFAPRGTVRQPTWSTELMARYW